MGRSKFSAAKGYNSVSQEFHTDKIGYQSIRNKTPPLSVRNFGILSHGLIFSKFSSILKKRYCFFKIFLIFLANFFRLRRSKFSTFTLEITVFYAKTPNFFRLRRFPGLIFSKFCSKFFSWFFFFKIFSNSESHGYFEEGGFVSY